MRRYMLSTVLALTLANCGDATVTEPAAPPPTDIEAVRPFMDWWFGDIEEVFIIAAGGQFAGYRNCPEGGQYSWTVSETQFASTLAACQVGQFTYAGNLALDFATETLTANLSWSDGRNIGTCRIVIDSSGILNLCGGT